MSRGSVAIKDALRRSGIAEKAVCVLGLLLFTGALLPLLAETQQTPRSDVTSGDSLSQALFFLAYAFAGLLLIVRRRSLPRVRLRAGLACLVILAVVSVLWSGDVSITTRHLLGLLGTTLFGVYFGTRFDSKAQLSILAWTLAIAAIGSLLLIMFVPSLGIEQTVHIGAWRGLFPQKNALGRLMALALPIVWLQLRATTGRRWPWAGVLVLSTILMMGSTSATARVITLAMLVLVPMGFLLRKSPRAAIAGLVLLAAVSGLGMAWAGANASSAAAALGRDATLTGRTTLWATAQTMIERRPLVGHGYGGFWLGQTGDSGELWRRVGWQAPHAHNGYLDLALDLGLLGGIFFLLAFLGAARGAIRGVRRVGEIASIYPLVFLAFLFLYNFTESAIIRQNSIFWVLFVAVGVKVLPRRSTRTMSQIAPADEPHLQELVLVP